MHIQISKDNAFDNNKASSLNACYINLSKKMRGKEYNVADSKDRIYYTSALDNIKGAETLKDISASTDITRRVYMVLNKAGERIAVFKTMQFEANDPFKDEKVKLARSEFNIPTNIGKDHEGIAKGICLEEKEDSGFHAIEFVLEYGGDDLLTWMNKGLLTGEHIITVARQSASAMNHSHKAGVFHSDLKPQNITFKDGVSKLIDFGVSMSMGGQAQVQQFTTMRLEKIAGLTECYSPPEIYNQQEESKKGDGVQGIKKLLESSREKIDIYLWGMTFYHLVSKKKIADLNEEWKVYRSSGQKYSEFKKGVNNLKLDGVASRQSIEFIKVISQCLTYTAADRPSFEDICRDMDYIVTLDQKGAGVAAKAAGSIDALPVGPSTGPVIVTGPATGTTSTSKAFNFC